MIRLGLAAAFAVMAASSSAEAAAPEYHPAACHTAFEGRQVDCGTLVVDESRGQPASRRVEIPVAIVRASAPKPGLPPVVYLHGGPGGSALAGLPTRLKSAVGRELIAIDQDWIFLDQRGAGMGKPALDCPGAQLTDAGPPSAEDAAKINACLRAFADQGINLSRYNAVEVARDVEDLRQVLKLPKIDLFGGSYGTRIEAAIQTHAPHGVRVVVQDSPWPPEGGWAAGTPEQVSAAVAIVLKKCAAQPECAARYPDVGARFAETARRWLAGPQTVGGKTYTHEDLAAFLMEATYSNAGVRRLPANLARISAGDLSPVDEVMAERTYYDEGQHMAHLCREELPFESPQRVRAGAGDDPIAQLLVTSLNRLFDVCRGLGVAPAAALENQPVKTPIPTLFLAAEIDPGCPPHLTEAAARGYSASQVVVVANATHGVTGNNACARAMARGFFADPIRPLDRSCLPAAGTPLPFMLD